MAGPTNHGWNAVGTFPVRVLLAAEWCHRCVRPGVHVRTVVGAVHNEGVVHNSEIIEHLENGADILVVVDHGVVVRALPASRLSNAFWLGVGAEMHVREVDPHKSWLAGFVL